MRRPPSMNNLYQKGIARRLETVIIAFFVLAVLFALAVYLVDPSIYTKTLLLEPSPADRYPFPATLFLVCLVVFIPILVFGVCALGGGFFGSFLLPLVSWFSRFLPPYSS